MIFSRWDDPDIMEEIGEYLTDPVLKEAMLHHVAERWANGAGIPKRISRRHYYNRIRNIIEMRLGGATLREIADEWLIGPERVRQIIYKTGRLMRNYVRAKRIMK